MTNKNIRDLAHFLLTKCCNISPKHFNQTQNILLRHKYNLNDVKVLCRVAILNRVYPICPYCGRVIDNVADLTIDHNIPRMLGGTNDVSNLQPMHGICNERKGADMPDVVIVYDIHIAPFKKKHHKKKPHHKSSVLGSNKISNIDADNIDKTYDDICKFKSQYLNNRRRGRQH